MPISGCSISTHCGPLGELRIGVDVLHGINDSCFDSRRLELLHDFARRKARGPLADLAIEFVFVRLARGVGSKFRVRAPLGVAHNPAERLPFCSRMDAEYAPAIVAFTTVGAMRRGVRIAVGVAAGDGAVNFVVEKNRRQILKAGFILSRVDVVSLTRAPAIVQRRQNCDRAVGNGDIVDIRPVEDLRRSARIAGQVRKSGERRKLRAESGMMRMRPALAQVRGAEHDEIGFNLLQGPRSRGLICPLCRG